MGKNFTPLITMHFNSGSRQFQSKQIIYLLLMNSSKAAAAAAATGHFHNMRYFVYTLYMIDAKRRLLEI